MFYGLENTQYDISVLLEGLLKAGEFPASVLFSGPQYSSRMYAALCVARYLKADNDSTIIISDRNHYCRLTSALRLFRKNRNNASRVFLFDTLTTFLKQYHGALLESSSSSAQKKKFSDASSCMELALQIRDVPDNEVESLCNRIEKSLSTLTDISKSQSVSINQIRDIRSWASTSNLDGKAKVVIIEGLENAGEGANNALLKILEEPPLDTHFILISENPSRIMRTILSRVRHFRFKPFTDEQKSFILSSIFVNPKDYADLESFFISYSGVDDALLSKSAKSLIAKEDIDLPSLVRELEKTQCWDRFYFHVLSELVNAVTEQRVSRKLGMMLYDELTRQISLSKVYNQVRRLTFDFVVFRTKEYLA